MKLAHVARFSPNGGDAPEHDVVAQQIRDAIEDGWLSRNVEEVALVHGSPFAPHRRLGHVAALQVVDEASAFGRVEQPDGSQIAVAFEGIACSNSYAAAMRSASSREMACSPSVVRTVTGPPNGA